MADNLDIASMIFKGGILKDVEGNTPKEVYDNICKKIVLPHGMSAEMVYNALCSREEVLSTAVGNGIALPHARTPIVKEEDEQKIVVAYLKKPINMNAPDERDVYVMFVLLTQNTQTHLQVLSKLAGLFRSMRFRKALENKAGYPELSALINELA
ncbi:MAG: PTS sugar transporter subunit IIA [Treponema sp.]|nr:PTS sugar transporter subunit IIA [Treponema sp.]